MRSRTRADRAAPAAKSIGLLVMGMHRSGTSAVTRTLNLLGAALPEDVLGPSVNNPLGHWEPRKTYELHNRLLEEIDTKWDDWTPIAPQWFRSPAADRYAHLLAEFLNEEFADKPLFVLKDPRMCRLAPLWRRAFEIAGYDPRIVFPVRNPLEVAASLSKRNGMPTTKAALLWLRYVADAEYATRDLPRWFIRYDELLANWRATTGELADRLEIVWPRQTLASARAIDEFLSPEHRHNAEAEDLARAGAHPWIVSAYEALGDLAKDPRASSAMAALDGVRTGLDQASTAFWPLLNDELATAHRRAEEVRLKVKGERNEAQREVERLNGELAARADLAAEAEQLRGRLDSAQSALHDRSDEAQRLSGELDAARSALRDRSDEVQRLSGELDAAQQQAASVERLEAEAERWREAARKVADEIGAKARNAMDEAEQRIAALEAKRMDALEELARSREEIAELRTAKLGLERQDERLAAELLTAQEELRRARKNVNAQRVAREAEVSGLQADNARLGEERAAAKTRILELKRERELLRQEIEGLAERARTAEAAHERLLGSASWRVTRPLRQLTALQQRLGRSSGARSRKV